MEAWRNPSAMAGVLVPNLEDRSNGMGLGYVYFVFRAEFVWLTLVIVDLIALLQL